MISCGGGDADSLAFIKRLVIDGHTTKEDYENALRSHQEYISEIKSCQRDEAAAFVDEYRYLPVQNS